MTRTLSVIAEFEQGTLVAVKSGEEYIEGSDHAYYVPDKARLDAGMQKVRETESTDAYRDNENGFDWDAIRDTVTAKDIVERAEQDVINRSDGDVGDTRQRSIRNRARGADDHITVPAGVVKFADPQADEDSGGVRDPVERGVLWGVLKDTVLVDARDIELQYQNDVQQGGFQTARLPVAVYKEGRESMILYLAAHDHSDAHIAYSVGLESEDVEEILDRVTDKRLD